MLAFLLGGWGRWEKSIFFSGKNFPLSEADAYITVTIFAAVWLAN